MAQRVRLKKKRKAKPQAGQAEFHLRDVVHPRERGMLAQGLAWGLGPLVALLLVAGLPGWRQYALVVVGGWIALAALIYLLVGEITERKILEAGEEGTGRRLQRMAEVQAKAIGMAPPEVVVSERVPYEMVLGHKIALPADLVGEFDEAEQWALVAHELGHMRWGHTFWLNLMRRSRYASGLMVVPGLPVQLVRRGLMMWEPYANFSADRLALLLTRDRGVLGQALLKQAAFHHPDLEVSSAEIVDYLHRPGSLQADGAEVTAHYKLGQLLSAQEDLQERLQHLAAYAKTDDYKRAAALIEEASARARGAAKPAKDAPPAAGEPPSDPPAKAE